LTRNLRWSRAPGAIWTWIWTWTWIWIWIWTWIWTWIWIWNWIWICIDHQVATDVGKTTHFEAECSFTAVKPYILKPRSPSGRTGGRTDGVAGGCQEGTNKMPYCMLGDAIFH